MLARSTIGRGRSSGRRLTSPGLRFNGSVGTTSRSSANIIPPGRVVPIRLSVIT